MTLEEVIRQHKNAKLKFLSQGVGNGSRWAHFSYSFGDIWKIYGVMKDTDSFMFAEKLGRDEAAVRAKWAILTVLKNGEEVYKHAPAEEPPTDRGAANETLARRHELRRE